MIHKLALMTVLALIPIMAAPEESESGRIPMDNKFFSEFYRTPPVLRDGLLENMLNSIVLGRGLIKSIDKTQRFKKKYRIVLVDLDAERMNVRIVYYIYIDSKNSISMLKENENLEFSGQLVAYTPANTKRDYYILDILFEGGAILVQ
ncbi:MAG: hypothetical protein A2176_14680 [Spirochaetes bacterium RBG_13_51_14]|nr:MAG: hypothetical protein A2176_14680 [Spirochaetes bacterium RBG_13_51_14]